MGGLNHCLNHFELIGIEIIGASDFLRDSILESTQAKLLHLTDHVA